MKKFLTDALVIVLIVCLLLVGMELVVPFFKNNYSYKNQYMQRHAGEIETLILGSSLGYNDINPSLLAGRTFNIALPGKNIYYDVQLLERHLPDMKHLHTVLYPIHCDMMIMRDYVAKSPRNYMVHTFMGLEHPCKKDRIYTRWLSLSGSLNIGVFNTEVSLMTSDSLGFYSENEPAKQRPVHIVHHEPIKQEEFTQHLTQLAKMCNEHGVRLITFTCPTHENEFNKADAPQICQRAIEQCIQNVRRQFPMEYKNYMSDPKFQADSIYYDWSHLNKTGATLFTKQLKEDFGL